MNNPLNLTPENLENFESILKNDHNVYFLMTDNIISHIIPGDALSCVEVAFSDDHELFIGTWNSDGYGCDFIMKTAINKDDKNNTVNDLMVMMVEYAEPFEKNIKTDWNRLVSEMVRYNKYP